MAIDTYYVDTAGSNTAPYDTWAKAATDLQTVVDIADSGDTVYCRGTQVLTSAIDFDTNSGALAKDIKFIGCNSGGTVDGTRFVLNGNGAVADCILAAASINYIWLENFELTGSTADGLDGSTSSFWRLINCIAHNNGTSGFNLVAMDRMRLVRCQAYNNTTYGFYYGGVFTVCLFCVAYGNGSQGFIAGNANYGMSFIGCVSHDNGDGLANLEVLNTEAIIMNCVVDGTDQATETGIELGQFSIKHNQILIGNRITNCATGIEFNGSNCIYGWNYFDNNTADVATETSSEVIPYDSDTDTNEYDSGADDGYNDASSNDFNIKEGAALRRTAIDLNFGS